MVSLASHLKYHWVFERLVAGHYDLFVTNEMLAEYQEQVAKRYGLSYTEARLDFLLLLPNVTLVTPFYRWLGRQQVCRWCGGCQCRLYRYERQALPGAAGHRLSPCAGDHAPGI